MFYLIRLMDTFNFPMCQNILLDKYTIYRIMEVYPSVASGLATGVFPVVRILF